MYARWPDIVKNVLGHRHSSTSVAVEVRCWWRSGCKFFLVSEKTVFVPVIPAAYYLYYGQIITYKINHHHHPMEQYQRSTHPRPKTQYIIR